MKIEYAKILPSGRLQTQPVLESCCQMVSMQLKAPTIQCQNCKRQLSLYGAFLWSFLVPSSDKYLWILSHCHTEILNMKCQNLLPSHTYLHQAVDFLIWDPCEVSPENEDIAFPVQCQGQTWEPGQMELNMAPADGDISLGSPQPSTRWWYKIRGVSYMLQKTVQKKEERMGRGQRKRHNENFIILWPTGGL